MNKIYSLLIFAGALLLLAACVAPQAAPTLEGEEKTAESQNAAGTSTAEGGTPAPTLPPEGTMVEATSPVATGAPATQESELKPADSDTPASGICADPPAGEMVKMTIRSDVPDPRCAKAYPDQLLALMNDTAIPVRVRLGIFRLVIHPGEEKQIDTPLGEYLQPGVHFIDVTQPGFAGELWLVEK